MIQSKTYHIVPLGCVKNNVDASSMSQLLTNSGLRAMKSPIKSEVIIVNTCGFIDLAREESLKELRSLAEAKQPGQLLIAAGCLSQRYGAEIIQQVPGVDGVIGTQHWMDIVDVVHRLRKNNSPQPVYTLPGEPVAERDIDFRAENTPIIQASVFGASAYLKIADGCRRPCAFCAIPIIKGPLQSRPLDMIIDEALHLQASGIKELILVAQDTTDYGHDLKMEDGLSTLLENLITNVGDLDWIRIMYAYPGCVTDRLIDIMSSHPQILPYLDIPLQHAHPAILKSMHRPANMNWVYKTIDKMRKTLPGLAIRTTFIVGYPGETEEAFNTLLEFMKTMRFDRVGAFKFSFEPGTTCASLGDPIPAELKEERYQRLMELQQGISLQINQSMIGKVLDVLTEGYDRDITIGRSYRDAPDIDGWVFIDKKVPLGKIIPVKINGALHYDLTGTPK